MANEFNNPFTEGNRKENAPEKSGQNVGGKVENQRNEGGTTKSAEDIRKANEPSNVRPGVTHEDAKNVEDKLFRKEDEKDGVTTVTSSISEEDAKKAEEASSKSPKHENLTQSLDGVVGNVDLTDGGRLNSDKSVRDDRSIEEINEETDKKAAAVNPTPNRDGNELTKMGNEMAARGGALMFQIDQSTNAMADKLGELRRKGSLTDQDKQDLADMENRLRQTGRL